jgi:hypothetical protein
LKTTGSILSYSDYLGIVGVTKENGGICGIIASKNRKIKLPIDNDPRILYPYLMTTLSLTMSFLEKDTDYFPRVPLNQ